MRCINVVLLNGPSVAIVLYRLFLRMTLGERFNAGNTILFLTRVAIGAYVVNLFLSRFTSDDVFVQAPS